MTQHSPDSILATSPDLNSLAGHLRVFPLTPTTAPGLRGTIRDRDGRPMPDAAVTLIVCRIGDGFAELIMDAARQAGRARQRDVVAGKGFGCCCERDRAGLASGHRYPAPGSAWCRCHRRRRRFGYVDARRGFPGAFTATASARRYNPAATTAHIDADPARRCEIVLTRVSADWSAPSAMPTPGFPSPTQPSTCSVAATLSSPRPLQPRTEATSSPISAEMDCGELAARTRTVRWDRHSTDCPAPQ